MDRILTVTTPAASKDLTLLATVKSELNITDSLSNGLISRFIASASRAAANYCNGELIQESVIEQFRSYPFIDGSSLVNIPEYIFLRRIPVTAISIVEDEAMLVNGTDFETNLARGRLTRLINDMPSRWSFRKLSIAYTGGYTFPGTLEPDIERAVIDIVKDMWWTQSRDATIRSEELSGVGKLEYFQSKTAVDLPPIATALLGPYQRPVF